MDKINFTYDPLSLVKLVLDRYAEELEGKDTKSIQFARYEYLRTLSNDELEGLLHRYVAEEKLEVITLKDWKKDSQFIFRYIYESERYKELEFSYKKQGYDGLGVADNSDNTFYLCAFSQHWQKVMEIVKEKYPHFDKALEKMYFHEELNEFNGITREQLDTFIMQRFILIGATKALGEYVS